MYSCFRINFKTYSAKLFFLFETNVLIIFESFENAFGKWNS